MGRNGQTMELGERETIISLKILNENLYLFLKYISHEYYEKYSWLIYLHQIFI